MLHKCYLINTPHDPRCPQYCVTDLLQGAANIYGHSARAGRHLQEAGLDTLAEALSLPTPPAADPRDRHGYYSGLLDDGTDPDYWPVLEYDPEALDPRNCGPRDLLIWPGLPPPLPPDSLAPSASGRKGPDGTAQASHHTNDGGQGIAAHQPAALTRQQHGAAAGDLLSKPSGSHAGHASRRHAPQTLQTLQGVAYPGDAVLDPDAAFLPADAYPDQVRADFELKSALRPALASSDQAGPASEQGGEPSPQSRGRNDPMRSGAASSAIIPGKPRQDLAGDANDAAAGAHPAAKSKPASKPRKGQLAKIQLAGAASEEKLSMNLANPVQLPPAAALSENRGTAADAAAASKPAGEATAAAAASKGSVSRPSRSGRGKKQPEEVRSAAAALPAQPSSAASDPLGIADATPVAAASESRLSGPSKRDRRAQKQLSEAATEDPALQVSASLEPAPSSASSERVESTAETGRRTRISRSKKSALVRHHALQLSAMPEDAQTLSATATCQLMHAAGSSYQDAGRPEAADHVLGQLGSSRHGLAGPLQADGPATTAALLQQLLGELHGKTAQHGPEEGRRRAGRQGRSMAADGIEHAGAEPGLADADGADAASEAAASGLEVRQKGSTDQRKKKKKVTSSHPLCNSL